MDFAKLSVKDETFCHLRHPATDEFLYTEEKEPVGFNVAGIDSDKYRKVQADILRGENNFKKKITPEKVEHMNLKQVIGCVIEPVNIVENGSKIKDDFESLKSFFEKYRWVYEQLSEFINDRTNFL